MTASLGVFLELLPLVDPLTAFLVAWWTVVGAMIGSFVNVVVWRLPRGESLSRRGSHCPFCDRPIRFYDNIPVLSYFVLGGRCRDCQAPISPRYPIVEALFALLFLIVALVEVAGELANLPLPDSWNYRPTLAVISATQTLHLILLSTLLTALLIERDDWPVPWKLFTPALLVAVSIHLVFPDVPPDGRLPFSVSALTPRVRTAMLLGWDAVVAFALILPARRWASRWFPLSWSACVLALHFTCHWQLAAWVTAAGAVSLAIGHWQRLLRPGRLFGLLFWWGLAGILGWRLWSEAFGWTSPAAPTWSWLGAVALMALGAVALRPLRPATRTPRRLPLETRALPAKGELMTDHDRMRDAILQSPTYRLPELDTEFLQRPELRPVRVQLELLKPEIILEEERIHSTVVVFGGTQIVEREEAQSRLEAARAALAQAPDDPARQRAVLRAERILAKSHFYDEARQFAKIVSEACQCNGQCEFVIVTGGGPGIMEAANRGAFDVGSKSIGLNITLPEEQLPNPYISPELCFQFHYFAMRKMHFLLRARALVVFPGGFGTFDELFDALTLRQTNRMQDIPIILYGTQYWHSVIDFQKLADEGVIRDEHLDLIRFADTPHEAWEIIARYHNVDPETGSPCHATDACPPPQGPTP